MAQVQQSVLNMIIFLKHAKMCTSEAPCLGKVILSPLYRMLWLKLAGQSPPPPPPLPFCQRLYSFGIPCAKLNFGDENSRTRLSVACTRSPQIARTVGLQLAWTSEIFTAKEATCTQKGSGDVVYRQKYTRNTLTRMSGESFHHDERPPTLPVSCILSSS